MCVNCTPSPSHRQGSVSGDPCVNIPAGTNRMFPTIGSVAYKSPGGKGGVGVGLGVIVGVEVGAVGVLVGTGVGVHL